MSCGSILAKLRRCRAKKSLQSRQLSKDTRTPRQVSKCEKAEDNQSSDIVCVDGTPTCNINFRPLEPPPLLKGYEQHMEQMNLAEVESLQPISSHNDDHSVISDSSLVSSSSHHNEIPQEPFQPDCISVVPETRLDVWSSSIEECSTLKQMACTVIRNAEVPLAEIATQLWKIFKEARQETNISQLDKARIFANLPAPFEGDLGHRELTSLKRTASLMYRQYALIPQDLKDRDESDIIVDGSCVGPHIMPPWSPLDEDIANNFYLDHAPTVHNMIDYRSPIVNGIKSGEYDDSPEVRDGALMPPIPGAPLGPTNISGWNTNEIWTDPNSGIKLSKKQTNRVHSWVRITHLPEFRATASRGTLDYKYFKKHKVVVFSGKPIAASIRQGFIGDCSFLASLSVLAHYECTWKMPVLTSLIHPQSNDGIPVVNKKGMYGVKLFFNGAFRKVLVDDFVPVRRSGKLLTAHTYKPEEMWVTILEKAFIKLMGGSYYMSGSNPAADLFHITGWIPETYSFRRDTHSGSPVSNVPIYTGGPLENSIHYSNIPYWNNVWDKLHRGIKRGHCVACLGTSEIFDAVPSGLEFPEGLSISSGITAKHAYALLGTVEFLHEGELVRLLFLKNPWGTCRWKGKWGPEDTQSWTPELQKKVGYCLDEAVNDDDGNFWIPWQDVIYWFSHLYICWNTSRFDFCENIHQSWSVNERMRASILKDDTHLSIWNPQYRIDLLPDLLSYERYSPEWYNYIQKFGLTGQQTDEIELKILFNKHILVREFDSHYLTIHVHNKAPPFICPSPFTKSGIYTNGECYLCSLRVRPFCMSSNHKEKVDYLTSTTLGLCVSQYDRKEPFNYTLRVYSRNVPFEITRCTPAIPEQWDVLYFEHEWNKHNAGGCSNDIWKYFINPILRLEVTKTTNAVFLLESPDEYSVNLRLFKRDCVYPRLLRMGPVENSGAYRSGACSLSVILEEGIYTLVPSTYKSNSLGKYMLSIFTEAPKCVSIRFLPNPHPVRPSPTISCNLLQSTRRSPFGGYIILDVDQKCLAAFKVIATSFLNSNKYVSLDVYRKKAGSRFKTAGIPPQAPSSVSSLEFVRHSDLEGGLSADGKTVSSAALELWKLKSSVTITLLELQPEHSPYVLDLSAKNHSKDGAKEEAEGHFTFYVYSDSVLEPYMW